MDDYTQLELDFTRDCNELPLWTADAVSKMAQELAEEIDRDIIESLLKSIYNMKIYLCGPIAGCTDEECKDWRNEAKLKFPGSLDPMRRDYRGREIECAKEIVELDKEDIDQCEVVLVNHPKPSVGSAMEILYAWEQNKYIIVVCPKGVVQSPWLVYHSNVIVSTFEEAYNLLENYFKENQHI